MTGFYKIWARRDSNPRPKDYESSALPLRHRPLLKYGVFLFSCFALPVSCASGATYCGGNVTFSHLPLQCHRPLLKYGVLLFSCLPCLCLALAALPISQKTWLLINSFRQSATGNYWQLNIFNLSGKYKKINYFFIFTPLSWLFKIFH